jgi:methyl-accepting chemotaxis protein
LTIGRKFAISCGAAVIGMLGASVLLLIDSSGRQADAEIFANQIVRKYQLLGSIETGLGEMLSWDRGILIRYFNHELKYTDEVTRVADYSARFDAAADRMMKSLQELQPLLRSEAGKNAAASLLAEHTLWVGEHRKMCDLLARADLAGGNKILVDTMVPVGIRLRGKMDDLVASQAGVAAEQVQASDESARRVRGVALVIIALALAIGAAVGMTVHRTNRELTRVAETIGSGATSVTVAAGQLQSTSHHLAEGASEQAATLEETSAAATEMTAITQKNADTANAAAVTAQESQRRFGDAVRALDEMEAAMHGIHGSTEKVSRIIKSIEEIAFQTNILALNAAVEAARAGEHGLGFAVVAEEVRNLAQRCAQAARDTTALIEEAVSSAGTGERRAQVVVTAIRSLAQEAERVGQIMAEVQASSREQAQGLDHISRSVQQIDSVTQRTASMAEENASAGEELASQASLLKDTAAELQRMVGAATS